MMKRTSPLREPELVRMLAHEPELLAIADALVETQNESRPHARNRWSWRPMLVAAALTAALAGAGVAIAAGFGAFNGISAAQSTTIGANILPPGLLARIDQMNAGDSEGNPSFPQFLPNTARVLGTMPDGSKVYGLTNTRGDLCLISEAGGDCGPPLSSSNPITASSSNTPTSSTAPSTAAGTFIASGVAMDGVTSVSFTITSTGKTVTVPVENNVWVYEEPHSRAGQIDCIDAHLANGSTVPLPNTSCP